MDKAILNATSVVDWKVDKPPANCTPRWVYMGRYEYKIGAIQIAIAATTKTPSKEKSLATGVFPSPAGGAVVTVPGSRNQELKELTVEITNWAIAPDSFPFK